MASFRRASYENAGLRSDKICPQQHEEERGRQEESDSRETDSEQAKGKRGRQKEEGELVD
eukprot:2848936-Pleurochrysis_carterae.AAC.3